MATNFEKMVEEAKKEAVGFEPCIGLVCPKCDQDIAFDCLNTKGNLAFLECVGCKLGFQAPVMKNLSEDKDA